MLDQNLSTERFCVRHASAFRLADHDPAWADTGELAALCDKDLKKAAKRAVKARVEELSEMQRRLYADDRFAVLIIFQAMDAAGKDGTIRHVMSGINPQGCQVFSFKQPSKEELDHNYLWRYSKGLPERLDGISRFFDKNPERTRDLVFVQIAPPSGRRLICRLMTRPPSNPPGGSCGLRPNASPLP